MKQLFNLLVLSTVLMSCATSYKFGTLESRYQSPSLPLYFGSPKDGVSVAIYGIINNQGLIQYSGEYQTRANADTSQLYLSKDTSNHYPLINIHETYGIKRDRLLYGGAVTWQDGWLFSGLTGGTSYPYPEDYHLGGFAGFSPVFGKFIPSMAIGLFKNSVLSQGTFWEDVNSKSSDTTLESQVYTRQSETINLDDWWVRFSVGMLYRLNKCFAPYLNYETGRTRFWPTHTNEFDDRVIYENAFGGGLEIRLLPAVPVLAAVSFEESSIPNRYTNRHITSKLMIRKEF
jgi:hypothetical protein